MKKMEMKNFIDSCNKKINCTHCGKDIKGSFSYHGGGTTSEDALKRHEGECEENPSSDRGRLKIFMSKCQKSAEVYNCLNCKHFQRECKGTNIGEKKL